jgi:hypothetical protein
MKYELRKFHAKLQKLRFSILCTVTNKTALSLFVVPLDLVESYSPIGDRYCLNIEAILPSE